MTTVPPPSSGPSESFLPADGVLPSPAGNFPGGESQDTAGELRGRVLRFDFIDPEDSLFLSMAEGD